MTADRRPVLYGIPNCDTVRKARAWLAENGRDAAFHDFRKAGVPADRLDAWVARLGWEPLVNRRGTTWRGLPAPVREGVCDATTAKRLMAAEVSVIRRPVVEWADGALTVGFDPADWAARA